MTTNATTAPTAATSTKQREAATAAPFPWRRVLLVILGVLLLFAATYLLAWWDADRLTNRYMADAEASAVAGNYLEALTGYQEFDEARNEYIQRGGYIQVERIWRHRNAWPVPATFAQAQTRIDEIIRTDLTLDQAEQFVQQNIGRANPYLGLIYLRLGELYEAEGDLRNARDVYNDVAELFANQPTLAAAQAHLARLDSQ